MKNKIHALNFAFLVLIFTFASPLQAMDYYVDQNHPSANDANTGTIDQPWETITKANTTLTAGDTVYIKAGTYTTYIKPSNSGTAVNRITYRNYGTDTVTIQGASYVVYLSGRDYITVQGINSTGCSRYLYMTNGSDHNIIAYCNFDEQHSGSDWTASVIYQSSTYNWIHHCQFSKMGECTEAGEDYGTVLDIGNESNATDFSNYNLIEDCTLFHGGHHVLGLFGRYNVVRNNYFQNEAWSRDKGNRTLYMNGYTASTGYNIIENNRFGYAAAPCDAPTVGNVAVSTQYNIFRYNKIYHSNAYGLGLSTYGTANSVANKIYNNTFFNNGYNIDPAYEGGQEDSAICFMSWLFPDPSGNIVKNNLYYSHNIVYGASGVSLDDQVFANNWDGDTEGDPKFFDASTTPPTDKTDSTLPNLDLQSDSPAINKGSYLTQANGSGSGSQTLIVDDAGYFQDGTWAPTGTIQTDWIAVGTVDNVVQISSISGNTITLASPITWSDNANIWLYKKSDGIRVLYGSAPDAGAYEVLQDPAPSPPKNLRIIEPATP